MKVFLDYTLNDSGKGKFLQRLIPALEKTGVEFSFKDKGCDVALGISWWRTETKLPKALRIDGIYTTSGKKEEWRNKRIRKSIKKSDIVIYQSKFAKHTVNKILKVSPDSTVIYNGANPLEYPKTEKENNSAIMCARWGNRKHKRLDLHLKYAKEHPETKFYLAGECAVESAGNIVALGHIDDSELRKYLSVVNHIVYLADEDWCPNAVVEAIVVGLPVIYNPECMAVAELAALKPEELYIDNIARQYKQALEGVLCKLP